MIVILHTVDFHQLAEFFGRFATVKGINYLGQDGNDHYFELVEAPKRAGAQLQHMASKWSVVRGFSLWKSPADMTPGQRETWRQLSGRTVSQNTAWGCFAVEGRTSDGS